MDRTGGRNRIGYLIGFGVKPVQEEKFVEISTPTFFPVFSGNLREKMNFLRFLQISPLVQCLPPIGIITTIQETF